MKKSSHKTKELHSTPGGVLHKMLKEIADSEPEIKFNIIEKGGITVEEIIKKRLSSG